MQKLMVVGVGPGDPELVTLKAQRVLKETPVVFYPVKSAGEKGIALEIVRGFIPPGTELVEVVFPMVKDRAVLEEAWKKGAETILTHPARWGAFVTLGCPQVYSTFFYLSPYLRGLAVEVVPGVTSFSACSARTGEPLILGDQTMAVLSASHPEGVPWEQLKGFSTLVFMKMPKDPDGVRRIAERLEEMGFSKLFYLRRCFMEGEEISEGLPENPQGYLAQVVFKKG